ncbi:DEAD/DEAH box helicase [Paracoccus sediminicola]|uniref:DEAD/DEAH box helicase n=1 Tax=Paracoccus sediminicola TaxID=3017783 RepID=UPI0022F036EE|nr:DEAD/DEAH box helicase family protein [Paracoccus sediminicola]WBU58767.1 DEAD/DEAH box helicase family protein [Paracoccus sediminicola]
MAFDHNAVIASNDALRVPQREGWEHIREYFQQPDAPGEVGIVLPVGCGKSGLIAITPYAIHARRVLVIAPGTRIRGQLGEDLRANSPTNFYERCGVLGADDNFPETVVVASGRVNMDDIRHCEVAVANIQQIAGEENRWLDELEPDFFDLILVDEAHHNTAASWQQVKRRFPAARIVNFSATPMRADGALMEGEIIYSFPVLRAIEVGYVKRLRAKMLRPTELRYIDRSSGGERIIGADEVRALGESNAEFRRGIVMSEETLGSIVDQSIAELRRLREETGEQRLKIIASALNYDHCIQISEAFRARGLRADYVHSREAQANERVFQQLENHELDVIVQARMLGEGFDHKYLAVAMVGSVFANLSPFVQFVGRIMRVIEQNAPGHPLNQGVVVFHVGANVARRWNDFRAFSEADQGFFADLLPEAEEVEFSGDAAEREFGRRGGLDPVEVLEERGVRAADLDPIGDPHAAELLAQLAEMGVTPDQAAQEIRRLRMTRQDRREARRAALNERVQNESGGILGRLGISTGGRNLDPRRRERNFAWTVAQLHSRINERVGGQSADRQNFTLDQLNAAHEALPTVVRRLEEELRNATA